MVIPAGQLEWISPDTLDALILSDTLWEDAELEAAISTGLPVVTNDRLFDSRIAVHVDSGYASMTKHTMDLFLARGATSPALLAEPDHLASDASAQTAYQDWCTVHGLEPLVENVDYARSALEGQVARLLERGADAIFSFAGEGIRVKEALRHLGKPIPSHTRLVTAELGAGEETVAAGITTVVYHANRGAKVAVPVLLELLRGDRQGPVVVETGWQLIEAASTF
jgi:DNA-binding LacI/PurR family transcriptional regulator